MKTANNCATVAICIYFRYWLGGGILITLVIDLQIMIYWERLSLERWIICIQNAQLASNGLYFIPNGFEGNFSDTELKFSVMMGEKKRQVGIRNVYSS